MVELPRTAPGHTTNVMIGHTKTLKDGLPALASADLCKALRKKKKTSSLKNENVKKKNKQHQTMVFHMEVFCKKWPFK